MNFHPGADIVSIVAHQFTRANHESPAVAFANAKTQSRLYFLCRASTKTGYGGKHQLTI
jgi:hypothetical protein